jgi:hypothetical protein
VFLGLTFCSGGPPNATENPGDTCDRIIWKPSLCLSHANPDPDPRPLTLFSPSPRFFPPFPVPHPSSVLGKAPCTHTLLTRVQNVPAAVLHRLFYGCFDSTRSCRVHKTSGAREAIDCVIEGDMELSRRLSSLPVNAPPEPTCQRFPTTVAGWNVCCMH